MPGGINKHVIICGAGASREAGGPLMADFLDRAEDLGRRGAIDKPSFDLVFRGLQQLQIAHSKASLDIDNVESVMAAFEMAELFGALGSLASDEVQRLTEAITTVVAQTVEESIRFGVREARVNIPISYHPLRELLKELVGSQGQDVSIITFNYDVALDAVLFDLGKNVDYGFNGGNQGIPLLKLHGSLSWTLNKTTERIHVVEPKEYLRDYLDAPGDHPLRLRSYLSGVAEAFGVTGNPVIVPPTWAKTARFKMISEVWKRAAQELHEAENIYVVGYSLPPTDQFFRLLYALGTVGPTRIKRFWVINPDPNVERRFRTLLGPAAKSRFRMMVYPFQAGIRALNEELRQQGVIRRAR